MTSLTPADEQRINEIIDARLKESRHENADHLDRGLLLRKLASSDATDQQVPVWDATTKFWTAMSAGAQIATGVYTTASATGSASVTGTGFKPRFLFVYGGYDTTASFMGYGIGAAYTDSSGAATELGSICGISADTPATAGRRNSSTFFELVSTAATVTKAFTITSFDADGFTFNRVTNDANAYGMYWVAIG